jgi:hypothetical protein
VIDDEVHSAREISFVNPAYELASVALLAAEAQLHEVAVNLKRIPGCGAESDGAA